MVQEGPPDLGGLSAGVGAGGANRWRWRLWWLGVVGSLTLTPRCVAGIRASKQQLLDASKAEAKSAVTNYCDERAYPFIHCERNPKNSSEWFTRGGSYGMGVFAVIENNPDKYAINVYQNLGVTSKTGNIKLDSQHLVTPRMESKIPVFIKVVQELAADAVEAATSNGVSYLEKERRRARSFGRKGYAPEYYDIVDTTTTAIHEIHDRSYIVRKVEGMPASDVLSSTALAVLKSMDANLKNIIVAARKKQEVDAFSNALIVDVWMWARLVHRMLYASVTFVEKMWARNLHHCDCHFGNIMFTRDRMRVADAALMISSGEAVAFELAGEVYLANPKLFNHEVDVYRLHRQRMQAIDLAYAVDLTGPLKKRGDVANPCSVYRPARNEDMFELYRSIEWVKDKMKLTRLWKNVLNKNDVKILESRYPHVLPEIQHGLEVATQHFAGLTNRLLRDNQEWVDCVNNRPEFRVWLKANAKGGVSARIRAAKALNAQCTVRTEAVGLTKLIATIQEIEQSLCEEEFSKTPQFEEVLCVNVKPPPLEKDIPSQSHQIDRRAANDAFRSPLLTA